MAAKSQEHILMAGFRQSDRQADKEIFQAYFRPMCFLSCKITGQMPASEDIVTEAFMKLFGRRNEFAGLENISAFLYVTIRNASISYFNTRNRHNAIHQEIGASASTEFNETSRMEIMEAGLLHAIYQEMENLPERCREIFKMLYLEGLSTQEIANKMGINTQTVRTQKARAIQLLKTALLRKNDLVTLALFMTYLGETIADNLYP